MTEPPAADPAPRAIAQRIAIVGNSGSGKSRLAQQLAQRHGLAVLELDAIVWEPGQVAVLRSRAAIEGDLDGFLATHEDWVIEGCYGELLARALPHCTALLFLNPGLERCLANNRARPWEPHKYASSAAQDAMLAALLDWVRGYYERDDAWSLAAHRRLFDAFQGEKCEIRTLAELDRALT